MRYRLQPFSRNSRNSRNEPVVPGLSPEQVRYMVNVLGVKSVLLPELSQQTPLIDIREVATTASPSLVIRGAGSRLLAIFFADAKLGSLVEPERDLAEKMFLAMKLGADQTTCIEWSKSAKQDAKQDAKENNSTDAISHAASASGENENDPVTAAVLASAARTILVFGAPAAEALGMVEPAIGQWLAWRDRRVMITLTPRELLKHPERKKTVWAHLQVVMKSI